LEPTQQGLGQPPGQEAGVDCSGDRRLPRDGGAHPQAEHVFDVGLLERPLGFADEDDG
jgi:hypothetical protein